MNKYYYVIETLLDPTEDSSYSLLEEATGENKATAVIKDGKANIYFEDGNIEEFEDKIDEMLARVKELNYKFIKLMNGDHRWKKYNPNPKSRNIGDCTLRSYCAAFGIEWEEAFDIASKIAKDNSSMIQYVVDKVLTEHFGCVVDEKYNKKVIKSKDRITVNNFAMTHPYGTYILHLHSHLVTVKNGEYWDSWDSGDKKIDTVYLLSE
jgi:hypothetical protein